MNDIFAFLHGREYVLNGVHGHFRHDTWEAKYPYPRTVEKLRHVPSSRGKRSEAYQHIKSELGDDWETDLTDSVERYCQIALELGYRVTVIAEAGGR